MLFRFVPALIAFACAQVALYLSLRELLPPGGQVRRRRLLAGVIALGAVSTPAFFAVEHLAVQVPFVPRALVVEPLLTWNFLSMPLVLLLGAAVSLARRLRASRATEAPAPPAPPLPAGPPDAPPAGPPDAPKAAPRPGSALAAVAFEPAALSQPRRLFLARAATGLLGGVAALGALGIAEAESEPELTRHEIALAGLHPDLDGLTILQLSDIHAGSLMTGARMERIARAAAALDADLVVITGDMLDVSPRAAAPYARAFGALRGKLGTFAVLGNHDYYSKAWAAERAVRDAGQVLLRNSGVRLGRGKGSFWLGGTDDPLATDHGGDADPARALRGAAPDEARIVLAHRPALFPLCARAGAQLVLSGHTHGGQIALSPRWSLARLIGPYTMGHFQSGGAQLFVHRGMGTVGGAPLRLGSPPELALLTLRRS